MSKRTWSVLLFVIATASLLMLNGGGVVFSFPGELITINAAGDSFTMGDGTYGPNVSQNISYKFKISKTEITNSQFQQFIDDGGYNTDSYWTANGWTEKTSGGWTQPPLWANPSYNGSSQPVVGVSWYEAVAFSNWLSEKEGLTPAYNSAGQANLTASGYRLPTEVEWEYAAAKGASAEGERIYAYGDSWDANKVVGGSGETQTANVGSKSPAGDTPQGLADMSGNVWEWCSDNYQADGIVLNGTDRYYFSDDTTGNFFVLRGGAWLITVEYVFREAFRYYYAPGGRLYSIGFRVVRP